MKKPPPPQLDFSYARAATILAAMPEEGGRIAIILVGCGGTGSYMAQSIGRLLYALKEKGTHAGAIFFDHDKVETKNVGRQLFCLAEVGQNKAKALAERFGAAWGLDIVAIPERFKAQKIQSIRGNLAVIVGCVDNAAGRKEISRSLDLTHDYHEDGCKCAPTTWWLDCGNHDNAGQVALGTTNTSAGLAHAFQSKTIVQKLPSPSLQYPDLLIPGAHEQTAGGKLSCAELVMLNMQSMNINARIAAEASEFLTGLLLTRDLKRYAWEVNLAAGSSRSYYATRESLAPYLPPPTPKEREQKKEKKKAP